MKSRPAAVLPELPPFCSGAVGYAGYDTVRYTERLHQSAETTIARLPDLSFAFFDRMVVFDHVNKTMIVVAMAHARPARSVVRSHRCPSRNHRTRCACLRRRLPADRLAPVGELETAASPRCTLPT